MKNFTYLLLAGMMLLPEAVSAREALRQAPGHVKSTRQAPVRSKSAQKAPARVGEYGDIIYEAPDGNVEYYSRSGLADYPYIGYLFTAEYVGKISEVVTCDNGDVYIKNPVSMLTSDSYLKGKKDGDKLVFDLPQAVQLVSSASFGEYEMVVTLLNYNEGDSWFYPVNTPKSAELGFPEVDNQFVININEDGSMSYDNGGSLVMGLMYGDDLSWSGYADYNSEYIVPDAKPVDIPDGISPEEVAVLHGGMGHFASLLVMDDEVFICGLFEGMPEAWVKGTRDGDKVTFKSGQYLGMDLVNNYFTYFASGEVADVEDSGYMYEEVAYGDEIVFDFNEETMTLTCGPDAAVVYNTSADEVAVLDYYRSPVITKQPTDISATPANPYGLSFDDYFGDYEYVCFSFKLPVLNVDGYLLDNKDLYYRVYVDGEEYEFDVYEYSGIEDNMTLVPYSFTDNYDFELIGDTRTIYFYFEGAEEFGVQLYNIKDGVMLGESEIVTISTAPNGVQTVEEGKAVERVRFFGMDGREVSNPSAGIYVKKVSYTDGTSKTFKTVRR